MADPKAEAVECLGYLAGYIAGLESRLSGYEDALSAAWEYIVDDELDNAAIVIEGALAASSGGDNE